MIDQNGKYTPGADPSYLRFQIYPLMDFTKFNFPNDLLTVGSIPGQASS
jgi:hypothetical protein